MSRSAIVVLGTLLVLFLFSCGSDRDTDKVVLEPLDTVRWGKADCSILKEGITFMLTSEKEGQAPIEEEWTIKNPDVHCTDCDALGLTVSELECYEILPGTIMVRARLTHADGRSFKSWKAEVSKGVFTGALTLGKADGSFMEYQCTGRAVH